MPTKNSTFHPAQDDFSILHMLNPILEKTLAWVDPYHLVDQQIVLSNDILCIEDRRYTKEKLIILVAMGKACAAMTQAVVDKLGDRIARGLCICKTLPEKNPHWQNIELVQGAHPVPDQSSLDAAQKIRKVVQGAGENDLVLVLVSGGSSALVVEPCQGITLTEIQMMSQSLLRCGATIDEINCVRKHVERLKGGGLARLIQPARIEALLLSDVIGNDMSVIASGPTVADKTTFTDALEITHKYKLENLLPACIIEHLIKGSHGYVPETLKPDDLINHKIRNTIIGSNHHAIEAAKFEAGNLGFSCECISESMTGEAVDASHWFLETSLAGSKRSRLPYMAVAGGETTVTVKGDGKGGRNLQAALAAVERMAGVKNAALITLATDGEDGPTDAAGAIVTTDTLCKANALGLDPNDFLERNDAYTFFEKVGGLVKTGSTGTNVNDLTFFFQL